MKKKNKRKKIDEKKLVIKFLLCLVYLIVITILFYCSYKLFQQHSIGIPWSDVEVSDDYAYIEVSKMSEKFAYYEKLDKEIHFVIEEEDSGVWHTYLIAIKPSDYNKYKEIIDFTYERNLDKPDPVKVYGYPIIIDNELKELAIKNINNFVPKENEVAITNENFDKYLTNSYLDTTIPKVDRFDVYLFLTLFMMAIMIVLFMYTVFAKEDDSLTPYKRAYEGVKKITNK